MDELSNPSGPRKESVNNHCREFMQMIKVLSLLLVFTLLVLVCAIETVTELLLKWDA